MRKFYTDKEPAGGEPDRQRCARPLEDRACSDRPTPPASAAQEPTIAQPPTSSVAADRTDQAGGPP